MRDLALELLKRVEASELAQRVDMPTRIQALSDTLGPARLRQMAMLALSLLPPSMAAPHVQLLLQRMREPDSDNPEFEEDCEVGMPIRRARC